MIGGTVLRALSPSRRDTMLGGAAAILALRWGNPARAADGNFLQIAGSPAQGGLVEGQVTPGSRVRVSGNAVRSDGGLFCFGFNYDEKQAVEVRVTYPDGTSETRMVTPAEREFEVQRIDGLPEQYVSPPPELQERIARDGRVVVAARLHDTPETWFTDPFAWPIEGIITGHFGNQRILNGEPRAPHYGLDIAAPEGTPIKSPAPGIVRLAEELFLSGNTMVIDHGYGVSTSYLHMVRMNVAVGDMIGRGDVIGQVGATGRATGPHLCWRMNWFQKRLDVELKASERA